MILVVDDDEQIRRTLCRVLERAGHLCRGAGDAQEARTVLAELPCQLVLCDVRMPGESGISLLRHIRASYPALPIVMVSAIGDSDVAAATFDLGAYGYVTKPFEANQVLIAASNALRRAALETENAAYRQHLEEMVTDRTAELAEMVGRLDSAERRLRAASEDTIRALSRAIEGRDLETGQHIERMSKYAALLAERSGMSAEECELIRLASPMHDVGKVTVPDGILFKPGRLDEREFAVVQKHAEVGYGILSKSEQPLLALAASISRTHHERWDGAGYPQGLAGTGIPVEGRIASIADVFDALMSRRVYKSAYPLEQTVQIMQEGRGTSFDPELLDLFLDDVDELVAIRAAYPDD